MNGVLFQSFQWYSPGDGSFWRNLSSRADTLATSGFTGIWLPPAYKGASGPNSVGYDCYDLFDLGEFDQKGTDRTKYGTRDEYLSCIKAIQAAGMQAYADVVFNHKDGADETEVVCVQEMDWNDRNRAVSDWFDAELWTRFKFSGRAGAYSSFQWYWWCFDAVGYNARTKESKLYRLKDKSFSTEVSHEHSNYDYLLADDIDTNDPFVYGELQWWGDWFTDLTGIDGYRLDACKHIRDSFFGDWLERQRARMGRDLFAVGEYWSDNVDELLGYLEQCGRSMSLFDVPLHFNFCEAAFKNGDFDMRAIFDRSLVSSDPTHAVTFVENHDTQPCQSLESPIADWFKPIAYALTLLRKDGYPCVFQPDYDGATYSDKGRSITIPSLKLQIDCFLSARRDHGFGDQIDYIDHWDTIGWTRLGDPMHRPMAVLMTTDAGGQGSKWMNVGLPNASFRDCTDEVPGPVRTNGDGWAEFRCLPRSVSVWLPD